MDKDKTYTITFSQLELQALGACFTIACLGPTAPGIDAGLQDAAGTAVAKIEGALFADE